MPKEMRELTVDELSFVSGGGGTIVVSGGYQDGPAWGSGNDENPHLGSGGYQDGPFQGSGN